MSPILERCLHAYLRRCAGLVVRMRKPRIVGITGSVGKTTTKEVIAAVLSHPESQRRVGAVLKSPGNLNDNVGLPFAVLGYEDWTHTRLALAARLCALPFRAVKLAFAGRYPDVLVLEYAACSHGDVPRLSRMAPPTVAVITAIGPAHLETFGTIERIAEEKGALVRAVPPDGLIVLAADNPHSANMDRLTTARVVKVHGMGRELSDNAARAVGAFFGVPEQAIEQAIRETPAQWRRLKVYEFGSFTVIDDSISANPLSTTFGLATLGNTAAAGRKVAVLGFMPELGAEAATYHQMVGAAARAHAELVVGIGELAKHYAPDHWFPTVDACIGALPTLLRPSDLVFVKGGQVLEMQHIVGAIRQHAKSGAPVPLAAVARR
jgi:UDP-N-acetylmuramoyl-tripeptide--D-alanyl-D-alanine ligase